MAFTGFTKTRFLLCEGSDDKHFFEALIEGRRLPNFQVCHAAECNGAGIGGASGFGPSLNGMEPLSGFRDLKAFLIVADNDIQGRSFADVQKAIASNGYIAPQSPTAAGSIAGKPVGVLMIPSPDSVGDLEALCLPAIYDRWPKAQDCVHSFLTCTGAANWTRRASLSKARVRAATVGFNEPDPYKGIGLLFKNGTLSVRHACFDALAAFLQDFDQFCAIA